MKKSLSLFAAGAIALAACGGGSGVVASTVDGENITVGQVEELIDTDGATITKDQFAQFLAYQIQWLIINAAAEADYGIVPTEDEVDERADQLIEEVLTEGQTRESFLADRGITESFLRNIARQGLLDDGISAILVEDVDEPSQEDIDAGRDAAIVALTNVCASHILVTTEEEANDVVERLDEGEDFAELATELSIDTVSGANGGDLGCASPGNYVEPFADATMTAPIGEVYEELVETQYGFHLILVTDRQEPAEADVPSDDELISAIKDESVLAAFEEWFLGAVEEADVTVGEEYGTWQANPPTVVAPAS